MAFATWMVGHIFLALNLRSDKEPLANWALLSNKVMLMWVFIVAATLLLGTMTAISSCVTKITSLGLTNWVVVLLVSFVATFWMEPKNW